MPDTPLLTTHKAWRIFDGLQKTVATLAADPALDIRPLPKLVAFIAGQFAAADHELASPSAIATVQQQMAEANNAVAHFAGDKNPQHITAARIGLQNVVAAVMTFPRVGAAEEASPTIGAIIGKVQDAADKAIAAVSEKVESQAKAVEQTVQQGAVSSAKLIDLTAGIDAAKPRMDSIIAEFQKQFSANENERAKRIESALTDAKQRIEKQSVDLAVQGKTTVDAFVDSGTKALDKMNKDGGDLLELLRKRDEETKALVVAMGARGISASFQSTANKNESAANWLRGITIFLLALLVVVVLHTLWYLPTLEIESTFARLVAALLIGLPAGYLAHESSRQRTEATRARRIELELTALGPFIDSLPTEKKEAVRNKLVDTYFGRAFDKVEKADDVVPLGGSVVDLVKALGTLAKK